MKYFKVSEQFLNVLKQLIDSLPHSQVKGVAPGFDMPEHCTELVETPCANCTCEDK